MCLLFWLLFPQGTQLLTWSLTWIAHLSCDKKYIVTCTSSTYDLKGQSHVTWRNWLVTFPIEVFPCLPSFVIVVVSTLNTMLLKYTLIVSIALPVWAYCETRNGDILLVHNANWIKHHNLLFISRLKNRSYLPFMDVSWHVHVPMDALKTFDESETSKNDDT